jgi:nucleoside-triphosphatase THEP1
MAAGGKHVFVTGQPGIGKSTLIAAVLDRLQEGGLQRGSFQGFWTAENRSASGARTGFDIITWQPDGTSKRGVLARLGAPLDKVRCL